MRITRSIVPNLFTLANVFMGFIAIINISQHKFIEGALFILFAGIFDMLDGVIARLLKSASEFGVELDSLCDAVSFGVAPAYMLYEAYFYQIESFGILISSLPALAGIVRLARFNIKLTSLEDKKYFTGLPIPSSALLIVSYIVFYHQSEIIPENCKLYTAIAVTLIASSAMVSHIKFDNVPRPSIRMFKKHPINFILFSVGVIASIITKGSFIFPFMLFFVFASAVRHFIFWLKSVREAADDIDESETPEPRNFEI